MQTVARSVRIGRVVGVVLCVAWLVGCGGGGPEGNDYVEYDGTTLIVEGTPYPREATLDPPGTFPGAPWCSRNRASTMTPSRSSIATG